MMSDGNRVLNIFLEQGWKFFFSFLVFFWFLVAMCWFRLLEISGARGSP